MGFIEKVAPEDVERSLASYEKSSTYSHEDELEAVGPLETLKIMKFCGYVRVWKKEARVLSWGIIRADFAGAVAY